MPTILQLQVFKYKKLIDGVTVDAIVAGRGTLNFAQDGIDIERVFTENRDAWRGKHPFTDTDIAELNLPTGVPFRYDLDADFRPTERKAPLERVVGDAEAAKAAAAAVAAQTG